MRFRTTPYVRIVHPQQDLTNARREENINKFNAVAGMQLHSLR